MVYCLYVQVRLVYGCTEGVCGVEDGVYALLIDLFRQLVGAILRCAIWEAVLRGCVLASDDGGGAGVGLCPVFVNYCFGKLYFAPYAIVRWKGVETGTASTA